MLNKLIINNDIRKTIIYMFILGFMIGISSMDNITYLDDGLANNDNTDENIKLSGFFNDHSMLFAAIALLAIGIFVGMGVKRP